MVIYALHGFLGQASDWDGIGPDGVDFQPVNIADPRWWRADDTFSSWVKRFNEVIRCESPGERVLVGYSLGGRLALASCAADPTLWDRIVLFSTHPGLKTTEEKQERLSADRRWLAQYNALPWSAFWNRWNAQPVFGGKPFRCPTPPPEEVVVHHLTQFSLGNQPDFRKAEWSTPTIWVAGGEDEKFSRLAQEVKEWRPNDEVVILPQAAHRVPWEVAVPWQRFFL